MRERSCSVCGTRFTPGKSDHSVCFTCRDQGLKRSDSYGVYKEEPLALSRQCRHPGCTAHPPRSGLYCKKHRRLHLWELEDAGRCLDSV